MKKSLLALVAFVAAAFAGIAAAVVNAARPLHDALTGYMAKAGLLLCAITQTETKADGANHSTPYICRHLDDAASPAAVTLYPGFRPRYVRVMNHTDRIQYEWFDGMAEGDYLKTVAAGTRTAETDDVIVVEKDAGSRASITLAASIVLQNKQYIVYAH